MDRWLDVSAAPRDGTPVIVWIDDDEAPPACEEQNPIGTLEDAADYVKAMVQRARQDEVYWASREDITEATFHRDAAE